MKHPQQTIAVDIEHVMRQLYYRNLLFHRIESVSDLLLSIKSFKFESDKAEMLMVQTIEKHGTNAVVSSRLCLNLDAIATQFTAFETLLVALDPIFAKLQTHSNNWLDLFYDLYNHQIELKRQHIEVTQWLATIEQTQFNEQLQAFQVFSIYYNHIFQHYQLHFYKLYNRFLTHRNNGCVH